MGDLDDIGFPIETAKPKIFQVRVGRRACQAELPPHNATPCCAASPQVLQNILGPTPFLHAKAGLWTTTIIENILKELKEINDESANAGQQDEEMGQLWKFVGDSATPNGQQLRVAACHPHLPRSR